MSQLSFKILAGLAAVASALPAQTGGVVPGKFVVALKPSTEVDIDLHARWVSDVHSASLARRGEDPNVAVFSGIDRTFSFPGFQGYSGSFDEETVEILKFNTSVLLVEPEKIYTIASSETQEDPPWGLSAISNANPPSSSSAYTYDSSAGEGAFAYVLDSGILLEHVEFEGRAIFGQDTSGAESDKTHGTHVAAIVNGATFGVAKKATVVDVQVLGGSSGSSTGVIAGISWAVNDIVSKERVDKSVINMSLIGTSSEIMKDAVQAAIDAGITVVAAAGNMNSDTANWSPANQPNAITVAGSNKDYRRWAFSNWGSVVDIFAPGEGIISAWPTSTTANFTTSGTSQAAPYVAGVVAYLLALEGPRTPAQMWERVQGLALEGLIEDTKEVPNLLLYNGIGA